MNGLQRKENEPIIHRARRVLKVGACVPSPAEAKEGSCSDGIRGHGALEAGTGVTSPMERARRLGSRLANLALGADLGEGRVRDRRRH
uniref:Uncharacterized protein n=1 Tax=Oryza nivara TaxID=4536 RepID=A0A0E0HIJ0_ORYNI